MFKVDSPLKSDKRGKPIMGEVFIPVAPGETDDVEGKFIPYPELVNLHRRLMELLDLHQVDLFSNDVDHALQLDRPPTLDEIKLIKPRRGEGSLGQYIIIKSDIEIIDGFVPVIIIGIKVLTESGLANLENINGFSFSAFGDFAEV